MVLEYRQNNLYPKVAKACYPLLGFGALGSAEEVKANNDALAGELETYVGKPPA